MANFLNVFFNKSVFVGWGSRLSAIPRERILQTLQTPSENICKTVLKPASPNAT